MRRYATELITLDPEATEGWAASQGKTIGSAADLAASTEVRELIEGYVTTANQKLERWETIKRFEILPAEFTIDAGEVTANQKIRRKAVEQKYADRLDSMYNRD